MTNEEAIDVLTEMQRAHAAPIIQGGHAERYLILRLRALRHAIAQLQRLPLLEAKAAAYDAERAFCRAMDGSKTGAPEYDCPAWHNGEDCEDADCEARCHVGEDTLTLGDELGAFVRAVRAVEAIESKEPQR